MMFQHLDDHEPLPLPQERREAVARRAQRLRRKRFATTGLASVAVVSMTLAAAAAVGDPPSGERSITAAGSGDCKPGAAALLVFFEPGTDEAAISGARQLLVGRPGSGHSEILDERDALSEFIAMFGQREEMASSVEAEDLPGSVLVVYETRAQADQASRSAAATLLPASEVVVYDVRPDMCVGGLFMPRHEDPKAG